MSPQDMKLIAAARANNLLWALSAIEEGADPGAAEEDGTTAIMWFAHRNNAGAVLTLGAMKPEALAAQNEIKQNVITQLARRSNYAAAIACEKLCPGIITMVDEDGYNAAMYLARSFNVEGLMAVAALAPQALTQKSGKGECAMSLLARWCKHDAIRQVTEAYPIAKYASPFAAMLNGMSETIDSAELTKLCALFLELGYKIPLKFEDLLEEHGLDSSEVLDLFIRNVRR